MWQDRIDITIFLGGGSWNYGENWVSFQKFLANMLFNAYGLKYEIYFIEIYLSYTLFRLRKREIAIEIILKSMEERNSHLENLRT